MVNFSIPKETHYFNDRSGCYSESLDSLKEYFSEFPKSDCISGEFTPRYYISHSAILRIKKHYPQVKLIVCMRNPLDRLLSQYYFFFNNMKKEPMLDIKKAIKGYHFEDYILKSQYYRYLSFVLEHFDRKNIHFIRYDDIQSNPKKVISKLYTFLGIEASFLPTALNARDNATKVGTRVSLIENAFNLLSQNIYYAPSGADCLTDRLLIFFKRHPKAFEIFRNMSTMLSPIFALEKKVFAWKPSPVSETTLREIYRDYFAEDLEQLELLLGMDFSNWKCY
jgi:hypothetical protein